MVGYGVRSREGSAPFTPLDLIVRLPVRALADAGLENPDFDVLFLGLGLLSYSDPLCRRISGNRPRYSGRDEQGSSFVSHLSTPPPR